MAKKYKVVVFGKEGCEKCKVLNKRIDDLLVREEWTDFEKHYMDVLTADGIVEFSKAECINPQRIPAFMVARENERTGALEPLPNANPGEPCDVCGASRLYQHLGLQTDYSEEGRGVISGRMIEKVLDEARDK